MTMFIRLPHPWTELSLIGNRKLIKFSSVQLSF